MADSACYIELASNAGDYFPSSTLDDVMIHPQYNTQRLLMGTSNGIVPTITMTSNALGVCQSNPAYTLDVRGNMQVSMPAGKQVYAATRDTYSAVSVNVQDYHYSAGGVEYWKIASGVPNAANSFGNVLGIKGILSRINGHAKVDFSFSTTGSASAYPIVYGEMEYSTRGLNNSGTAPNIQVWRDTSTNTLDVWVIVDTFQHINLELRTTNNMLSNYVTTTPTYTTAPAATATYTNVYDLQLNAVIKKKVTYGVIEPAAIGIGLSNNPVATLDVAGNIQTTEAITAAGAELNTINASSSLVMSRQGDVTGAIIFSNSDASFVMDMFTAPNNNLYVVGYYKNGTALGAITINNLDGTSSGLTLPATNATARNEGFVIVYNSNGQAIQRARIHSAASTGYVQPYSVTVDSNSNLYVCGLYNSSTSTASPIYNFDDTTSAFTFSTTPTATQDAMLIKYNSSGVVTGAFTITATYTDVINTVCCDSANNVYIAGNYNHITTTITLKNMDMSTNSSFSLPPTSTSDGFVIKFNSSGVITGVTTLPSASVSSVNGLAKDSYDNIYVSGYYGSSATFSFSNMDASNTGSGITLPIPANSTTAALLMKFNSSGIAQGVSVFDGGQHEYANGVCTDSQNNVYMCGQYVSSVNMKNIATTSEASTITLDPQQNNATGSFIAKWDSTGTAISCTKVCDTQGSDIGRHICCDSHDNLYIVGQLGINTSAAYVHNFSVTGTSPSRFTLPVTSVQSPYIVKYNKYGLVTAASIIAAEDSTSRRRIAVDSLGQLYHGGSLIASSSVPLTNLDGTSTNFSLPTPSSTSSNTGFLVRYSTDVMSATASNVIITKSTYINSNVNVIGNINFTGSLTQNGTPFSGSRWSASDSNLYIGVDSNVGIGLNNPAYPLQVIGTIHASGDVISFSDRRYKTNLSLIPSPLQKVTQLSGYTYTLLDATNAATSNKRHTGVIAQELDQVLPEAVHCDSEGKLSVAYGNMAGLFVEAIKELNNKHQNEVKSLNRKITELQQDVDDLRRAFLVGNPGSP